jgi:hypothetical protein
MDTMVDPKEELVKHNDHDPMVMRQEKVKDLLRNEKSYTGYADVFSTGKY